MAASTKALPDPRSSALFAQRLRQRILRGAYARGEQLPTERALALEARLGRGSIREALRILETEGLVQTHAGRHGGTVVSCPSDGLLLQQIDAYAKTHGVPVQ